MHAFMLAIYLQFLFRIVPTADIGSQFTRIRWAPGARLVHLCRTAVAEDGLDNSPCRLDRILTHEQLLVALHGVGEQALVGLHLIAAVVLHRRKFDRHGHHQRAGTLDTSTQAQLNVRPEPEAEVVTALDAHFAQRRLAQLNKYFSRGYRQALARADKKRNSRPTPGVDFQSHCREGLHVGVGRNAGLVTVTVELSADDVHRT